MLTFHYTRWGQKVLDVKLEEQYSRAMEKKVSSERELHDFGVQLGELLKGGEVIELVGDVGAGKTTLVKAVAKGMGVNGDVSSPSYTISQLYDTSRGTRLAHYDFYRLSDPGILSSELEEVVGDRHTVVAIEWGDIVADVLPEDHLQIRITPLGESERRLLLTSGGVVSRQLVEALK